MAFELLFYLWKFLFLLVFFAIFARITERGYGKKGCDYRIEDGNGAKWVTKEEKIYFEEYNNAIWKVDHTYLNSE